VYSPGVAEREETIVSHRITEECIVCGACQPECPEQAIIEGAESYIINPEKCSDCGNCAEVCPVGACLPE
jgi:NAD-dependent dihydropyrimidine dehydrogenase PreA subunit